MRSKFITVVAAGTLLLTGCASSTAPASESRECIEVPEAVMSAIAEGANAYPITPIAAAGVRSESFDDVTVIAMSFTPPDGKETTATWAIGGTVDQPGLTLAVDAMAQAVTDWPGQINGSALDATEDGVAEAQSCLSDLSK